MATWCIEKRMPDIFLDHIKSNGSLESEFYKFFRYFGGNGPQEISYLFRIQFQQHILTVLKNQSDNLKAEGYKNFYQ